MFDIPGYNISQKIAEGGCAEIYGAVDRNTGVAVAVKILHPRHLKNKAEYKRLVQEGELCLSLKHDNIVHSLKAGVAEGRPYLVLEYLEGKMLRELIAEGRKLNESETLKLTKGLCRALAYLHNAGICHKDVKPDNVMITKTGKIKLIDFGFAENFKSFSLFGRKLEGSPPYMAPELLTSGKATPATDIYALGCTLYEAATGFQPFGGMSKEEIVANQTNMGLSAKSVVLSNPEIAQATDALILTALEKSVAKRFKSIDEMHLTIARHPSLRHLKGSQRLMVSGK
jgi:serine/threonine protein kinase